MTQSRESLMAAGRLGGVPRAEVVRQPGAPRPTLAVHLSGTRSTDIVTAERIVAASGLAPGIASWPMRPCCPRVAAAHIPPIPRRCTRHLTA
jgi:hypothetical protein